MKTSPLKRWSARLVHRAQAPDQRLRVWAEFEDRGLSGLFLGTYSTSRTMPYAGSARRVRPVSCGSAAISTSMPPSEAVLRVHAQGMRTHCTGQRDRHPPGMRLRGGRRTGGRCLHAQRRVVDGWPPLWERRRDVATARSALPVTTPPSIMFIIMSGSVHIVAVMPAPQGGIVTCNRLGILICAAMFAERTVTATRTLRSASFTLPGPSVAAAAIANPAEE